MHSFSYSGQSVANWEHAFTVGSRSQTVETEILNPTRFLPPASSLLHGTAPASKRLGSVDSVILNVQDMSCMIIIMNYKTATVTGRARAQPMLGGVAHGKGSRPQRTRTSVQE